MATIKSMIEDKLRQKGESPNCGRIRGIVRKLIDRICESQPDGKLEGREFVNVISQAMDQVGTEPIDMLVDMAMEDRNDLCDYPIIRQRLERAINDWR